MADKCHWCNKHILFYEYRLKNRILCRDCVPLLKEHDCKFEHLGNCGGKINEMRVALLFGEFDEEVSYVCDTHEYLFKG